MRPRWFRFSLRTLFVLVTLLAVWLGWNLHWVHARAAMLERIYQGNGTVDDATRRQIILYGLLWEIVQPGTRLPWSWQVLGARPIKQLDVHRQQFTGEELERMRVLFPEAEIAEWYFKYE